MKIICIVIIILSISCVYGIEKDTEKELTEEDRKIRVIDDVGNNGPIMSIILRALLRCFRRLFIEGDETSGFPSLQTLDMGDFPIDTSNNLFSLKTDVTNFIVYGLGNFTINHIDFNLKDFTFDYDLEFHMTTSGNYANALLSIMNIINVYGDGDLNLEMIINPVGTAKIASKIMEESERVIEILDYYGYLLIKPNFQITGINHDEILSSAISKQLSLLIEQLVKENADTIGALISPFVKDILNEWIPDPDSYFNQLINLAFSTCLDGKIFLKVLREEAIKRGIVVV